MKYGEIYWVNLEETTPPEFGKTRPGIIVSSSEFNEILPTVVIIPLSTRPSEIWPLRVEIFFSGGLKKSYAVTPGVRQVSKLRLIEKIGILDSTLKERLQEALHAYLSK